MTIGIIVGSMQAHSNSAKVGRYLADQLQNRGQASLTLDLGREPLPLWGSMAPAQTRSHSERLEALTTELAACEGFVVISPEYHGMAPAALKNAFLHFGSTVFAHKPGYLVGVSAGNGGAYPIAELRMSSTKNHRLCYTPEHCIVRHADQVLNGELDPEHQEDARIRNRLNYGLDILLEYAKALTLVRQSGVVDHAQFANGM
nr:NAD(P)H-dependent oxidoreductase [Oceanococcus sp. HetDA_MAG_MS8]